MNETTMNLISAIKTGDVVGMEDAFNSAMAERVAAQMDTMRINVAQTMFKSLEADSSTEE